MSVFSKDIIEKDPCHEYCARLLELNTFEYWKEHPQVALKQLFEFHTGHSTKDFNDNEDNVKEGYQYMQEVKNIFQENIADFFGFTGHLGYIAKTFYDQRKYDAKGNIIHQNNQHPDMPIWIQTFVDLIYIP